MTVFPFITVHTYNGAEIRINVMQVESYGAITDKTYDGKDYTGYTYIYAAGMKADDEPYMVQETPEEIDYMITLI